MKNAMPDLSTQLFGAAVRRFHWDEGEELKLEAHLNSVQEYRPKLSIQTMMDALGVPNGANVEVLIEDDDSISVIARHADFGLESLYTLVYVEGRRWQLSLQNIVIAKEHQQQSVATVMLLHGFTAASKLGFTSIRGIGIRSSSQTGYAVWPILGFDGVLDETLDDTASLAEIRNLLVSRGVSAQAVSTLETVQDLLLLEGGRILWQEFGYTLDMTFDLKAGSPSWSIFEAYLNQKGLKPVEGWYA